MKNINLTQYHSYDPPVDKLWKEYYDKGFIAFIEGKPEESNPYKESGHERDSTPEDERNLNWYLGWWDAYDERGGILDEEYYEQPEWKALLPDEF